MQCTYSLMFVFVSRLYSFKLGGNLHGILFHWKNKYLSIYSDSQFMLFLKLVTVYATREDLKKLKPSVSKQLVDIRAFKRSKTENFSGPDKSEETQEKIRFFYTEFSI
jgi:hypothetical protein